MELSQKQVAEEFKCMLLKPLYVNQNLTKHQTDTEPANIFRSKYKNMLHSVVCMITTQQEGYLYQFADTGEYTGCLLSDIRQFLLFLYFIYYILFT